MYFHCLLCFLLDFREDVPLNNYLDELLSETNPPIWDQNGHYRKGTVEVYWRTRAVLPLPAYRSRIGYFK